MPSRNLLRSKKSDISTYVVGVSVNLHDQHALHCSGRESNFCNIL